MQARTILFHAVLTLTAACSATSVTETTEVAEVDEAFRIASEVVYVSTNTGPIHVFTLDTRAGQLRETSQIDGGVDPTYMAFARNGRLAYAIDEANPPDSKVLSFAVDAHDGHLTAIDSVETGAVGAPHLAVHPSGRWLVVPHYGRDADDWTGGQTVVIPVARDGQFGEPTAPLTGPADCPCQNAHQAVFTSRGRYVLVPCLGADEVVQYRFDDGQLSLNDPPAVQVAMGAGPRHLALSPDQRHAYLVTELAGTIIWFDYDERRGRLSERGTVQATKTPIAAGGEGWSAHIVVHPSGKFLYVSNRQESAMRGTENSLGVFALGAGGEPTPILDAFIFDGLDTVRDFAIDPSGEYLISANQEGDHNLLVFRIDRRTGRLTRTQALPLSDQPAFVHAGFLQR